MANRSLHHKHLNHTRKAKREPFDYILYFFMIATPLFEVPQALTIYANHSAENVSLLTWLFFSLDNLAWITYGFKKKQWPVFITSILYEIIEVCIVIGILIYD